MTPILLLIALPAPAKTLKELLLAENIPLASFSAAELAAAVQDGYAANNPRQVELAYSLAESSTEPGPVHVVKLDRTSGRVRKAVMRYDSADVCSGALDGVMAVGDFTLVSTDISPDAQCVHVLNNWLAQTKVLYGFSPHDVGQDQIVLIENMTHFAPVHPERLQLADLRSGATVELYPPKDDVMRAKMARENAEHMPPSSVCGPMNDPCNPRLFDEDISIAANGKDRFALIVNQSASHAPAADKPTVTVVSQWALYIYARAASGWLYCEGEISENEATSLIEGLYSRSWFPEAQNSCIPALPVVAEPTRVP